MTPNASTRPIRILLGISGGIAAYKTPELVRQLRARGAEVRVVMTRAAESFLTPLTLQAVSGHAVRATLWDPEAEAGMDHIALARWADRVLIAPATAHLMARLAQGLADDLLTTLLLATEAPVWIAPTDCLSRATRANVSLSAGLSSTPTLPGSTAWQRCGCLHPRLAPMPCPNWSI